MTEYKIIDGYNEDDLSTVDVWTVDSNNKYTWRASFKDTIDAQNWIIWSTEKENQFIEALEQVKKWDLSDPRWEDE